VGSRDDQSLKELVEYMKVMYARIAQQEDIGKASRLHSEVTAHLEETIGKLEARGLSPQCIRTALAGVELPNAVFTEDMYKSAEEDSELPNGTVQTMLVQMEPSTIVIFLANCTSPLTDRERFVEILNMREALPLSLSYEIINLIASGYRRENEISEGAVLKTGFGRQIMPVGFPFRHASGIRYTVMAPVLCQSVEKVASIHMRLKRLTLERFQKLYDTRKLIRADVFPESDRRFVEDEAQYVLEKTMKDFAAMKRMYAMAAAKHHTCIILRLREDAERNG